MYQTNNMSGPYILSDKPVRYNTYTIPFETASPNAESLMCPVLVDLHTLGLRWLYTDISREPVSRKRR